MAARATDLSKVYGQGDTQVVALDRVSVGFGQSQFTAIMGWQAFLRRFDIEHLFRLMKQTLGWTRPKLRSPRPASAGPG